MVDDPRLAVVEEHGDNFPEIAAELFEGCALAVCPGKTGAYPT